MLDKKEELQKLSQLYATWSTDELARGTTVDAAQYAPEATALMHEEMKRRGHLPANRVLTSNTDIPASSSMGQEGRQVSKIRAASKRKHGVIYHISCGLVLVFLYGCIQFIAEVVIAAMWLSLLFTKGKPSPIGMLLAMIPSGKFLILSAVGFAVLRARWFRYAVIPAILIYSLLFCLPLLCLLFPKFIYIVIYAASKYVMDFDL